MSATRSGGSGGGLRLPWAQSDRPVPRRVIRPLQSFLDAETASGILIIGAVAIAIAWANSPWRATYEHVWGTEVVLRLSRRSVSDDLRGWIRDGLMTFFFLVVGFEIKRELITGELRDRRAAILPLVAAVGGMLVPALAYIALTAGSSAERGWGIAMPTDIAFALGVLLLASRRTSPGLKVFLLALAIVDDLGSILVVAIFYSSHLAWASLAAAAGICVAIVAMRRVHVQADAAYVAMGVGLWFALRSGGVSPTLAGVALGLLTPCVPFQRPRTVSEQAHRVADETVDDPVPPDADAAQWFYLADLARDAVSPLARMESLLHPWASYVVVPLFALSNAGVPLIGHALAAGATSRVAVAIVAARVLGKTLGIWIASGLAVRIGLARLPRGVSWRHVVGVAAAAGIPFTVSLFVAELSIRPGTVLDSAKLGILAAALIAGLVGFLLLRAADRRPAAARR
jgi:NhaA family Na+:H+ antiporter